MLDRDGVINRYPGDTKYVTRWKEFRFLPRAKKAIAKLYKDGFKLFIISNQAGVGKGEFSKESLNLITKNMLEEIKDSGGKISGTYYCTHRKEEKCPCRKPKTGLIDIIKKNHSTLELKKSFFIGDSILDVLTAKAASVMSILVLSGKEKLSNKKDWETEPDFIFGNLYEASKFILNQK